MVGLTAALRKGFGRRGERRHVLGHFRGQPRVEPPAYSLGMKQSMCWLGAVGIGGSSRAVGEEGKERSREGSEVSLFTWFLELFRGELFLV